MCHTILRVGTQKCSHSLPQEGSQTHEPYLQRPRALALCAPPPALVSATPLRARRRILRPASPVVASVPALSVHPLSSWCCTGPALGRRTSSTGATRSEEVKLFFLLFFPLGNSQMKWRCSALYKISD
jgi:hypothetical protein